MEKEEEKVEEHKVRDRRVLYHAGGGEMKEGGRQASKEGEVVALRE